MGIPVDSSSPAVSPNCTTLSTALPPPSPESPPPSTSCSRCLGLDLLAMAALQLSGAAEEEEDPGRRDAEACDGDRVATVAKSQSGIGFGGVKFGALVKRTRRQTLMPSKYQDSVLQPWKRGSRKRRPPATAGRLG